MVVDRDVQVLPSDPAVSLRAARLGAQDTLARFPEAAELLGAAENDAPRRPLGSRVSGVGFSVGFGMCGVSAGV